MKKFLIIFLGMFMFSFANAKTLKVGMELAYPPFEMTDKDGNPSGISVDLAKALAKHLGMDVEIQNIAWDGLIPSLKTGKIDLIISSMTVTEERKKSINFSIPYAQANLAILTYKNSGVKNIDDLKNKRVAVKKGSTGHIWARDHIKNAKILVFDKESAAVLEVIQKKAEAFIYGQLTIYRNWAKHKDTTDAILKSFQDKPEHWAMALRHDDKELKAKVDEFITKAKSDGTFDKLAYKYLKDVKETFDKLGIEFFF